MCVEILYYCTLLVQSQRCTPAILLDVAAAAEDDVSLWPKALLLLLVHEKALYIARKDMVVVVVVYWSYIQVPNLGARW